jgi:hypothetical protein
MRRPQQLDERYFFRKNKFLLDRLRLIVHSPAIPAHLRALSGRHARRRSRERRPAAFGTCHPRRGRPGTPPLDRKKTFGFWSVREELAERPGLSSPGHASAGTRSENAAVERREASALRQWAQDASLGVERASVNGTRRCGDPHQRLSARHPLFARGESRRTQSRVETVA